MKQYNRVMLGAGGCFAEECYKGGYIGADFSIKSDLSADLTADFRKFNEKYVPVYLTAHPEKTKTGAGLCCGFLWTICKGLNIGDIVLSPNGKGGYLVGEIIGDYYYEPSATILPHRRNVKWSEGMILRNKMSDALKHSTGSIGTCCDISKYSQEIEKLMLSLSPFLSSTVSNTQLTTKVSTDCEHYKERDLHKLFCTYLHNNGIYAKTIYHEHALKKKDSNQKWIHPDIVGVSFEDFQEDCTRSLQKIMDVDKSACIYSYEMKKEIKDDYQLKQCFFQALSNSSWANFGYLVAFEIDDSLVEEINRLNQAFGIGVIRLQARTGDTQIICESRKNNLDYNTIDKLCHLSPDFKSFINNVNVYMNAQKAYAANSLKALKEGCDDTFSSPTECEEYCKSHNIPY